MEKFSLYSFLLLLLLSSSCVYFDIFMGSRVIRSFNDCDCHYFSLNVAGFSYYY